MKVNIGNREFEILDCLYYLLKDQKHEALIAESFFSNNFDINNPIQYCVINYILKPTDKR
jgi:hypothetical protein